MLISNIKFDVIIAFSLIAFYAMFILFIVYVILRILIAIVFSSSRATANLNPEPSLPPPHYCSSIISRTNSPSIGEEF
jgi:hypothetical protein